MRKTIAIICLLLCAISVNAQKEHLEFLGISMNTDFNYFKTQLAKKGIYPDHNLNDGTPVLKSDHTDIFFKDNIFGSNVFTGYKTVDDSYRIAAEGETRYGQMNS